MLLRYTQIHRFVVFDIHIHIPLQSTYKFIQCMCVNVRSVYESLLIYHPQEHGTKSRGKVLLEELQSGHVQMLVGEMAFCHAVSDGVIALQMFQLAWVRS